jgi:hypothetical protein
MSGTYRNPPRCLFFLVYTLTVCGLRARVVAAKVLYMYWPPQFNYIPFLRCATKRGLNRNHPISIKSNPDIVLRCPDRYIQ